MGPNAKPIPWVRIHKLPEYVHFPHTRHVNAGVTCQTCHGQIQNMDRVYQFASLNMGWCVSCHVNGYSPKEGLEAAGYAPQQATPSCRRAPATSRRPSARRRATTAPTATTDMSPGNETDWRQAPRVPQGPRRVERRARGHRVLREDTGKLIPYLVSPDQTVPGVSTYYATTCRECAAGVRRHRRDARRPRDQARGQSRASAEPRRALRARPVGAAGPLQSRSLPRARWSRKAARGRRSPGTTRITRLEPEARRGARREPRAPCSSISTRAAASRASSTRGSPRNGMPAHLSVDFEADAAAIEANRRAYGVAWPALSFQDAKLIVSFGADFLDGWGASVPQQLDFADARAKLDGAPRFVYIGPRRSLTGLNADRMDRVQAGQRAGDRQRARRARAASTQAATDSGVDAAVLQTARRRARAREAGARAVGRERRQRARRRARRRRDQPGVGRRRHDDQARASRSRRSTGSRAPTNVLAAVERMRARSGRHRVRARREPGVRAAEGGEVRRGVREGARSRSASRAIPDETTELCDLILPDLHSLESWGDAEPVRGTIALQQPAMDPVLSEPRQEVDAARALGTADVLIQVAKKGGATNPTGADYRSWLIAGVPGRRAGAWRPRCRRASRPVRCPRARCAAGRAPHRAADADGRRRRAISSSSRIRRRCLAMAAARTSRGCRSCPIRSRRSAGARGSRSIPRRRIGSASIAATSSRSRRRRARCARRRSRISEFIRRDRDRRWDRDIAPRRRSPTFDPMHHDVHACSGATVATRATSASTRSICFRSGTDRGRRSRF